MTVKTYVALGKSEHPHISVYPMGYPHKDVAGKVVARNSDSTSRVILNEVPATAIYCGSYQVNDVFGHPL